MGDNLFVLYIYIHPTLIMTLKVNLVGGHWIPLSIFTKYMTTLDKSPFSGFHYYYSSYN